MLTSSLFPRLLVLVSINAHAHGEFCPTSAQQWSQWYMSESTYTFPDDAYYMEHFSPTRIVTVGLMYVILLVPISLYKQLCSLQLLLFDCIRVWVQCRTCSFQCRNLASCCPPPHGPPYGVWVQHTTVLCSAVSQALRTHHCAVWVWCGSLLWCTDSLNCAIASLAKNIKIEVTK